MIIFSHTHFCANDITLMLVVENLHYLFLIYPSAVGQLASLTSVTRATVDTDRRVSL